MKSSGRTASTKRIRPTRNKTSIVRIRQGIVIHRVSIPFIFVNVVEAYWRAVELKRWDEALALMPKLRNALADATGTGVPAT